MAKLSGRSKISLVAGALAATGAVGIVCGAATVHYNMAPYRWVKAAKDVVMPPDDGGKLEGDDGGGLEGRRFYDSIFFRLEGRSVNLPGIRPFGGGALAALGDKVVLITQGGVFFASGPEDLERIDIALPDNGISAYRTAAATEKYAQYEHKFIWLRYNDIYILQTGDSLRFFISFTKYFTGEECFRTVVADYKTPPGVTSLDEISIGRGDWSTLYQTEPCLPLKPIYRAIEGHMAGGRMVYNGDGELYLASGDYHWDGIYADKAIAQLDDYDYGKVIEIDIATGTGRAITKGHRNMQGIAFDQSGNLYVVEHGLRGGDELNRVIEGRDYGFPSETLGTLYNKLPVPHTIAQGRHDVFEPPVFAWLPSVAISSLNRIDGFHEIWDGDLLMATLKDQSLYRIRTTNDGIQFAERIEIGERIRYALQLGDQLVLWTDSASLIFLTVSDASFAQDFFARYFESLDADPQLSARVQAALMSCRECHSLEVGDDQTAPSLGGVFGARIASTGFGGYSDALNDHGERWTRESLSSYIADPNSFAEGTTMPVPGVTDPEIVAGVIDFLEALTKSAVDHYLFERLDTEGNE